MISDKKLSQIASLYAEQMERDSSLSEFSVMVRDALSEKKYDKDSIVRREGSVLENVDKEDSLSEKNNKAPDETSI